jgi:hypothetical protein
MRRGERPQGELWRAAAAPLALEIGTPMRAEGRARDAQLRIASTMPSVRFWDYGDGSGQRLAGRHLACRAVVCRPLTNLRIRATVRIVG